MRKLFYWWAFMDLNHKCKVKNTYFYEHADEVAEKNLSMIKNLSIFISIIGIVVIAMALTFFEAPLLALIYIMIIGLELISFVLAHIFEKIEKRVLASNLLSSVYLLHMLTISSILGTVYSREESALVYVVVLIISQMVFILPPILTTFIAGISMIYTFALSYHVKSLTYFKSDIINCVGVFILSVLLGWLIVKIRIEEAEARNKAIILSKELKKLSLVDQLTNMQNHRSFQNTYYTLFENLKSTDNPIGIIMMDIDKFKLYNDGYGHLEGDRCLSQLGSCFGNFQNEDVIPYRFGGEEFIVIIKGDACKRISDIAEQFRAAVEQLAIPHAFSTVSNIVTISVGYYVGKPANISKPTQLIDYADQALYVSKKAGGNIISQGDK